jgi:hypothetical protein
MLPLLVMNKKVPDFRVVYDFSLTNETVVKLLDLIKLISKLNISTN